MRYYWARQLRQCWGIASLKLTARVLTSSTSVAVLVSFLVSRIMLTAAWAIIGEW